MKQSAFAFTTAAVAGTTWALPSYASHDLLTRQDPNPWIAPGPGDVRAPCPGLNTLANHGFINRTGRGVSMQAVQQGFLDAFGMGFDATAPGATNAINLCSQTTSTTCQTFDLEMLDVPHMIEHDGSLTRLDRNMSFNLDADNYDFNQTIWNTALAFFGDASHIDAQLANTARLGRNNLAQQQDAPGWFLLNAGGPETEAAFYLTTMNDPTVGTDPANPQARLDWINYWFSNEELPTALGWTKPSQSISGAQVTSIASSVGAAPTLTAPPSFASAASTVVTTVTAAPKRRDGGGLLAILGDPASSVAVDNALASATAAAGPAPTLPNAYSKILSQEEWTQLASNTESYFEKLSSQLTSLLGISL